MYVTGSFGEVFISVNRKIFLLNLSQENLDGIEIYEVPPSRL